MNAAGVTAVIEIAQKPSLEAAGFAAYPSVVVLVAYWLRSEKFFS